MAISLTEHSEPESKQPPRVPEMCAVCLLREQARDVPSYAARHASHPEHEASPKMCTVCCSWIVFPLLPKINWSNFDLLPLNFKNPYKET